MHFYLFFIFTFAALGLCCCAWAFLQSWRAGATLRCSAQASHCGGFSYCEAWALGTWAQQLWLMGSREQAQELWRMGLVAPRHVGSSRTGAQTCVPCIGRLRHQGSPREEGFFNHLFYHETALWQNGIIFFKVLVHTWIFNSKTLFINYSIILYLCSLYTKLDKVGVFYIVHASPGKHCYKNSTQLPVRQVHGQSFNLQLFPALLLSFASA